MGSQLTEKVLEYQRSGLGMDDILEEISKKLYRYPSRKYGWSEDDCSDFYLCMYDRIPKMVEKYHDTGFSFEAYLYATLKWQMRTFIQKRKNEVVHKFILETQESLKEETMVSSFKDTITAGEVLKPYNGCPRLSHAMRKRLKFVLLKNFFYATEEQIEKTALLAQTPVDELIKQMEMLRNRMLPKIERLARLRERRNRIFFRIQCIEFEIHSGRISSESMASACRQLGMEKEHLHDIQKEISGNIVCPTHKDIAEIMCVPKGTVDSGLYYLRMAHADLFSFKNILYA